MSQQRIVLHSNWNVIWLVHLDSVRQLQNVVSYYPTIYNRLTKWWVWLVYEYSLPLFVVMCCVAVEYEHRNRIATSYIWTTPLSGSSLWDYTWMDNVRLQFNIANHGIIHGITERNGWCDDYNKYIQCDVYNVFDLLAAVSVAVEYLFDDRSCHVRKRQCVSKWLQCLQQQWLLPRLQQLGHTDLRKRPKTNSHALIRVLGLL